jgi:hypothetical protein
MKFFMDASDDNGWTPEVISYNIKVKVPCIRREHICINISYLLSIDFFHSKTKIKVIIFDRLFEKSK